MRRYPGIRPFSAKDKHLFNGRDQEKRDLFRLIVLHDLVVLFGKSGIGKTSLLRAGVCPDLEDRNIHPIFIRLNNTEHAPETQVYHALRDGNYLSTDIKEGLSLWEYFKQFWYVDIGEVFSPVIIFDQFEELFTLYTPEQRQEFVKQLAAVANGRMPIEIRERINSAQDAKGEQHFDWESPIDIKFVFSIRSDYLYLLDELSEEIPAILRCRFHLKMLDKANAAQAIQTAAALEGDFESPNFSYSTNAIDTIINELGKEGEDHLSAQKKMSTPEIEAFQLQLLCQYIEEQIIEQDKKDGFQVEADFFGNASGIQDIIGEFYNRVLGKIPKEKQENVMKMLGKGLVRNDRRIIMEGSVLIEEFDIDQATLEFLHKERLLHKEPRKGTFYYEINHDTLIEPIQEKYQFIAAREQQAAYEKQLEEERQKRRKAFIISGIGMALAALAFIGLFIVNLQRIKIKENEIKIRHELINSQIQAARTLKVEGKYQLAIDKLNDASNYISVSEPIYNDSLNLLKYNWTKIDSLVTVGNKSLENNNFKHALINYRAANKTDPDNLLQKHISDTKISMERKIAALLTEGNRLETIAKSYSLAQKVYQQALDIKSEDEDINDQIRKAISRVSNK